jgi:hypothetical protein
VKEYGLRLLRSLYTVCNPMPCGGTRDIEVALAIAPG